MESMAGIKGKTFIVTGGTGFIGSHLCEAIADAGGKVIVFDVCVDRNSYFTVNHVYKKVTLELVDIRDRENVLITIKKYSPDYIFHLAAEPIVEEAFQNPHVTFETNIMGTVNILEAARFQKQIKGVIVASTDKAYGKTTTAYNENSPLNGDHPYDVSKSAADLISQTYFKTYALPVVITRFGNVYGEGDMHLNRIIPGICEAVVRNKPLDIRSDGKYVRDYLYVKDVVQGYLLLLQNLDSVLGEAFNFSSNESLQVLQVVKLAEKILKVKIPYKILNTAKNEIPYQHLDDKKIRKIGFKNAYSLESTLPKIKEWYEKTLV